LTLVGAGTTTITASQVATANWLSVATKAALVVYSIPVPSRDTFGSGTNTFTIDFVPIGNPGNSNDISGYGGVPYTYRLGKYTISQNQIDAATRNGLQNVTAGAWIGDQPAANISWYEAAAYVNWLNTSKGYAPAYNLTLTNGAWSMALWQTTPDSKGNVAWINGGTNLYRNANCVYFLPSENEWYKAAYYDPGKSKGNGGYWLYSTGSNLTPSSVPWGTSSGTAVFNQPEGYGPASVKQAGGLSPYGIMGQGGNVWQWIEKFESSSFSVIEKGWVFFRGGAWYLDDISMQSYAHRLGIPGDSSSLNSCLPLDKDNAIGFRVARKP
jgi:formylglycine-generating enzyme